MSYLKTGVDFSKHNGTINWDAVKSDSKVQFAIIRSGFGRSAPSQRDPKFEYNYENAKRVDIPLGAYHYSYAQNVEQAEQEADFVLEILRGKKFEYPIYFDIEDTTQTKLSMELCSKMITAFCTKLERAGYWAGMYSYDCFFGTNIADDVERRFACWVARVTNNRCEASKPKNAVAYQMWQYSWKGKVNGVVGDVDMNECYVDYPTLIKGKGLNGYGLAAKYTVTARMAQLSEKEAMRIIDECKKLGMNAVMAEQ